jgi:tRNA (guanosine-2'-O-)-methyltransferase
LPNDDGWSESIEVVCTQFLFENPTNPSNVWACLRSLDSFGIQHVHIVTESHLYQGKAALLQKQGMRPAMGSAQWLTIHHYISSDEGIQTLRNEHNCRILASDLKPSSIDIRNIDWRTAGGKDKGTDSQNTCDEASDNERPICIVMGNELNGISDTMRRLADATFTLPMVGFAEVHGSSILCFFMAS